MPHSHRYEKRRKLEVMHNSAKRLYDYADSLRNEALSQHNDELATVLANIMVKTFDIERHLEELSKPLTGYALQAIVGRSKWQTSEV